MRLARHLAVYDLRAVRRLAAAWMALLLVGFVLIGHRPAWLVFGYRVDELTSFLLTFSRLFGVALLVAVIVQRDPLDDPSAFWRTRPIPRVVLWSSKMVATGAVTVLMPAALLAVTLWSAGLAAGLALGSAADLAVDHAAVAAAALLIAVPTRSIAQAIAGAFVVAASLMLLAGVLGAVPSLPQVLPRLSTDQLLGAGTVAALAVTATHYLTLRRRLALSLSVALAGLLVVPSLGVPDPSTPADDAVPPVTSGAVVTLGPEGSWRKASLGEEDEDRFSTSVRVTTAAPDTYVVPTQSAAVLRLPSRTIAVDRATIDTRPMVSTPATVDDAPYANVRALLGVSTVLLPPAETVWTRRQLVLPVTRAAAQEMEAGAAHLSATLTVSEYRLTVVGHLPVTTGAMVNTRWARLRIARVATVPGDVVVDAEWLGSVPRGLTYVLVSGDKRRASIGRTGMLPSSLVETRGPGRVAMAGWRLSLTSVRERVAFALPAATAQLTDGAWRGATLHVIETTGAGRRRVAVEADGVGRLP